jgi:signal peptidase I
MPAPRKPWLAVVLSVVLPGLGHLYNGRAPQALMLFVVVPLSLFLLLWLVITVPVAPLNAAFLLGVPAVLVFVAASAFRQARAPADRPLPWYSRWWVCVGVLTVHAVFVGPFLEELLKDSWARFADMPSSSMLPTILPGDRLVIDRSRYGFRVPRSDLVLWSRSPARGDVVELISPHDKKRLLKRVIGLPGEAIEARDDVVSVDGVRMPEPYALVGSPKQESLRNWGPVKVPAGHVFVLGDNRHASFDSRWFGFVKSSDVLGRAEIVYFSLEWPAARPRWDHTGRRIH